MPYAASAELATLPGLPLEEWKDTHDTLHMWTQIVGKIQLVLCPRMNHWWEVVLHVNPRGLESRVMAYGSRTFQIRFDFLSHEVVIETSADQIERIRLRPMPVAEFYREMMSRLSSMGIDVKIYTKPMEVPDPIRFEVDYQHASYDPEQVSRFMRILSFADTVFQEFRSRFIGKCSPVHFFWGSFDLAVSRFSGRRAPERVGADSITREAYSHEVISTGFWPGSGDIKGPAFYSYTAPEPAGLSVAPIRPRSAFYDEGLHEFLLMYDDVRKSASPKESVLDFAQSTYEAGANLARWDRNALERPL